MRYVIALSLTCCCCLLAADGEGFIKARGKPVGAGMFVDGKYVGPAGRFAVPEKYSLPAGEHEISFRDPRYQDYITKVTVSPRKTAKIHYSLKPAEPAKPPFGRFRLKGDEPRSFLSLAGGDIGAVYINDRFFGHVDELNNAGSGILLNPGTYTVRIASTHFGEITREVKIEANKVTTLDVGESTTAARAR